jgi:hypothetical protein
MSVVPILGRVFRFLDMPLRFLRDPFRISFGPFWLFPFFGMKNKSCKHIITRAFFAIGVWFRDGAKEKAPSFERGCRHGDNKHPHFIFYFIC